MYRLNCWMCTLFAAFFCFILLPRSAMAASATTAEVGLVQVATITAQSPAEGWYAWKHQSAEYKKAYPWEGPTGVWCANSTRLGISCTTAAWKKVPAGTVFLLPAPEIRVYVPQGVEPPKALMLTPTDQPQLLQIEPSSLGIVTEREQRMAATIVEGNLRGRIAEFERTMPTLRSSIFLLAFAACMFILVWLWSAYRREQAEKLCRDHEQELFELKRDLVLSRQIAASIDASRLY